MHVSRFVVAIIIDAVKDMFRRRFASHNFEELMERIEQKFDATSTVIDEITTAFASLLGVAKCIVFGTQFVSHGFAMSPVPMGNLRGSERAIFSPESHK